MHKRRLLLRVRLKRLLGITGPRRKDEAMEDHGMNKDVAEMTREELENTVGELRLAIIGRASKQLDFVQAVNGALKALDFVAQEWKGKRNRYATAAAAVRALMPPP